MRSNIKRGILAWVFITSSIGFVADTPAKPETPPQTIQIVRVSASPIPPTPVPTPKATPAASTETLRTPPEETNGTPAGPVTGVKQVIAENWPGDDAKAIRVARCESNLNPRAVSKSGKYLGLFQFDRQTWRSVGGSGNPIDASVKEQTKRAWKLRQARGWKPWPVCGRR